MVVYGITDIGKTRSVNQDSFLVKEIAPGLALTVVCDGMGGAAGGAEASSMAIREFEKRITEFAIEAYNSEKGFFDAPSEAVSEALCHAVKAANTAVYTAATTTPALHGMGTTLAAALVTADVLYGVNVGDSRIYICLQDGSIRRLSKDHSYVQYLVDMGEISEDEAKYNSKRNIITRAVGIAPDVEPDTFVAISEKSRVLICSDGLTAHLDDSAIQKVFSDFTISLEDASKILVTLANEAGGIDNITTAAVDTCPKYAAVSEE